jgi:large subunit ribosomal protein L24
MKIKKGDKVKVIKGKDRGKTGEVEKVFLAGNKVTVSGVNIYKKHKKPGDKKPGGIIDLVKPLPVSNVALICPKCGLAAKVGYKIETGKKYRLCKKCKEMI